MFALQKRLTMKWYDWSGVCCKLQVGQMCIVENDDKDFISFPNFPSAKEEYKSTQTETFVFCGGSGKSRLECFSNGVF